MQTGIKIILTGEGEILEFSLHKLLFILVGGLVVCLLIVSMIFDCLVRICFPPQKDDFPDFDSDSERTSR